MTKVRARRLMVVATVFFWFSQYGFVPYFNPYLNAAGISATVVGFIASAYGIMQFLLRIPLGMAADRHRIHKTFILMGTICATTGSIGLYFSEAPVAFFIFRALTGVAGSSWVAFTALFSDYYDDRSSVESVAILVSANYLGRMVAFIIGGFVAQSLGDRYTFLMSAIAGIISFALCIGLLGKEKGAQNPVQARELLTVFKDKNLVVVSILGVCAQMIAFGSFFTYSSDLAKQAVGAQSYQLSIMNILLTIPAIFLGHFFANTMNKKLGTNRVIGLAFVNLGIYCAAMPFATHIMHFYVLALFVGLGNGAIFAILMGLCAKNVAPEKKTTAMGVFQSVYAIGMMMGPIVSGTIVDAAGLRPAFFVLCGICVVGVFIAWQHLEKLKKDA